MNKAIIIGRLPRDPELKWLDKDNCVVRFQLGTNERWTDKNKEKKERTDWHTFSAWGKKAEIIAKWAKKGDLMSVEGKLRNNNYQTKDGTKVYGYEILVEDFQFLTPKKDQVQNSENNQPPRNNDSDFAPPDNEPEFKPLNANSKNEDDIPF